MMKQNVRSSSSSASPTAAAWSSPTSPRRWASPRPPCARTSGTGRQGRVQRVHGGAIKPDTELSRFENRVDLGADVKKRLAELAMDEICENRVIFIDGGSTNYLAAQAFPRDWEAR